jgi:hypothetical protein
MVDTSVGGVGCHLVVVHLAVVARLAFHLCRFRHTGCFQFYSILGCSLCCLSISRLVIGQLELTPINESAEPTQGAL